MSEGIARSILTHFGNMSDLRAALENPNAFPDVPITASGVKLGRARVQKLAEVFA